MGDVHPFPLPVEDVPQVRRRVCGAAAEGALRPRLRVRQARVVRCAPRLPARAVVRARGVLTSYAPCLSISKIFNGLIIPSYICVWYAVYE